MVSRRNFFAMVLTMLILFFMFQFTGIAKNVLNEYGVNEYVGIPSAQWTADSMYRAGEAANPSDGALGSRPYIVFVGGGDSEEIRSVVWWWCTYTKRGWQECGALSEYKLPPEELPEAVVIDGKGMKIKADLPILKEMAERGVHLIFARLPEVEALEKNSGFCEFVGIREIHRRSVALDGVHLFEGFLLGGERIYEPKEGEEEMMDLELEVPWYMTGEATKTYIMGLLEDSKEYKNEMLPALVWRKSVGNAKLFCVNMDALSHMYGVGFLSAMMAEADSCEVYPVVNAQNLSVVNFLGFADENGQAMEELYSQSQTAVYRDMIWPMLVSLTGRSNLKMTLMMTPQLDYTDQQEPKGERLIYYLKQMREVHGEMGFSAEAAPGITLAEKLSLDQGFYEQASNGYQQTSLYVGEKKDVEELLRIPMLNGVRTIAALPDGGEPAVSYLDTDLTVQCVTADAKRHSYSEDLELMGVETALGYSNIALDLKSVSHPASSDDYWENLSRTLTRNIMTYWKNYRCFAGTSLTESDARIRRFLALDYRAEEQKDGIVLRRNEVEGPVWFLLKVNGKTVKHVKGGSWEELKGGFYLLEMDEREAVVEFADKRVSIRE